MEKRCSDWVWNYCYKAVGFHDLVRDLAETYHVLDEEWKCKEMEWIILM